jgi:hypothetical protein
MIHGPTQYNRNVKMFSPWARVEAEEMLSVWKATSRLQSETSCVQTTA